MGCEWPCKIVLILVNVLTVVIGIAVMAIGGLMAWGNSFLEDFLTNLIEPLTATISIKADHIVILIEEILTATAPLGIVIFIIGAILVGTAAIGLLGLCCSKIFLYLYATIIGVLAIAVLGIFLYFYVNRDVVSDVLAEVYKGYVTKYISLQKNDENTLVVLLVQGQLQCCGDTHSADFINYATSDAYGNTQFTALTAPLPCCKLTTDYLIKDTSCPATFTTINSNKDNGCRPFIKKILEEKLNIIAYVMLGIFAVLIILMLLAILAACCM